MTRRSGFARAATVGAAAVLALLLGAAPAFAHAKVLRTSPATGQIVDARLRQISVTFDDPVRLVPRSLVVTGATGAPVVTGAPRVIGGRLLAVPLLDRLAPGRYMVGWRILSDDGHVESGSFGFSVAAAGVVPSAAPAGGPPPAPTEPVWPVLVAVGLAMIALLGAALVVHRGLRALSAVAVDAA